ncbi:MAG: hypothetical protein ACO4AU_08955 [bacterium]|jgi:two-component system sensor histidine kinase ChiS
MKRHSEAEIREEIRVLQVSMMVLAVQYWQEVTLKERVELAMESGAWRVSFERNTYQARTMERYLKLSSLPQRPNTAAVLRTVYFVLEQSDRSTPLRTRLRKALDGYLQLEHSLCLQTA